MTNSDNPLTRSRELARRDAPPAHRVKPPPLGGPRIDGDVNEALEHLAVGARAIADQAKALTALAESIRAIVVQVHTEGAAPYGAYAELAAALRDTDGLPERVKTLAILCDELEKTNT